MKKIKAICDYMDKQLNRIVLRGEVYEVTDARAEEITCVGYAQTIEEKKAVRKKVE